MANTFGILTADPFGLDGVAGKLEKFVLVSVSESASKDGAVVKDATGEYIVATDKTFNEKTDIVAEYEANDPGDVGAGEIATGAAAALHVTSVAIATTNTGYAKVTVTGHNHGVTVHTLQARTIKLPAFNGFGGTNFLSPDLTTIVAADVQSSSWSITLDHVDKQNNVGNFLCGVTAGAKIEASVDAVNDTEPAVTETTWKWDSKDIKKANQDFYSISCKAHQYLAAP